MEQMTNVLVIRVPRCIDDVDKCLEYIKRGLRDGVLILGADVSYTVERFPKLGSIRVECGEDGNEQGEPAPELSAEAMAKEIELPKKQQAKKPALQARGIGAAEKKEIFGRLCAYRDVTGAGWAKRVAENTKPQVSAEIIRAIVVDSAVVSLDTWRSIGRALDALGVNTESKE